MRPAGHEVLASLAFGADRIDAVELNPATHDLVTDEFADFDGRFSEQPGVNYVNGDGRSFLARSDDSYDLIWYPAPDSYAATNAADRRGVRAVGELPVHERGDRDASSTSPPTASSPRSSASSTSTSEPNRTTRYVGTVRQALENDGHRRSGRATSSSPAVPTPTSRRCATRRSSSSRRRSRPTRSLRFAEAETTKPGTRIEHLPGATSTIRSSTVLTLPDEELDDWYSTTTPTTSAPIDDDGPFFWHFAAFADVVRDFGDPIDPSFVDPEDAVGERVLLLLLVIATGFAASSCCCRSSPCARSGRRSRARAPRRSTSPRSASGSCSSRSRSSSGSMLFLGYPTYSLTVTLASLLIFTGVGALLSQRYASRVALGGRSLAIAIVVLTAFYLFALPRSPTRCWTGRWRLVSSSPSSCSHRSGSVSACSCRWASARSRACRRTRASTSRGAGR